MARAKLLSVMRAALATSRKRSAWVCFGLAGDLAFFFMIIGLQNDSPRDYRISGYGTRRRSGAINARRIAAPLGVVRMQVAGLRVVEQALDQRRQRLARRDVGIDHVALVVKGP